jgi:predicted lysophospholipase L1 biosynthesis ABC-type transport system permease subunit
VADARYRGIRQPSQDVYVPHWQIEMPSTNYLIVRAGAPPAEILSLVRRTLKELDPNQTIGREATLGELIDGNTARDRFNLALLLLFGVGAVVLAVAGIHSVTRESVAARAKEIAVRMALGAQRGEVTARTASRLLLFITGGILLGIAAVIGLGSAAESLLYGISPREPFVLLCVGGFVLAIATLSSFFPAWAAAGKDPREQLLSD